MKTTIGEPIEKTIKSYYEKRMFYSIKEEIYNKLDKVAKEIAEEIMSKYDVKQVFYEKSPFGKKDGEVIITTVLRPKQD